MRYRGILSPIHVAAAAAATLCLAALPGQAQTIRWLQQFGTSGNDQIRSVATDATGNVYVAAGFTTGTFPGQVGSGGQDAFLRKYDAAGNVIWTRQFGTVGDDVASGVALDNTGVYVVGTVGGALLGQTAAGAEDAFLRKYDAAGNVLWTTQFGTASSDSATSVAASGGAVYVAGTTSGTLQTSLGGSDAFVRRYGANGALEWTRQFGTTGNDSANGAAADETDVYVAGSFSGPAAGQTSAFVRRYDASGSEQWTRTLSGPTGTEARHVALTTSSVHIVGTTPGALPGQSNAGFADAFVSTYDLSGTEQWTRQFGTPSPEAAQAVAADPTGVYVVGQTSGMLPGQSGGGSSDFFSRKYDVVGNDRWTLQFGTASVDAALAISAEADGIYVAGHTGDVLAGQTGFGLTDAVIFKQSLGGPPYLPINSIVNGASFQPLAPVTAGSIASAFGLSLAPESPGGASVTVGGVAAPIFLATPTQINFQVPWELAGQPNALLTATVDGSATSPVSVALSSYAPGIFSSNASGAGQGAILIANTAAVAAPLGMFPGSRPVPRGDSISIFCTGLGPVSNQPPTGVPASANPLSETLALPAVSIGGVAASVSFSGLAPGFFGLYQVNAQVPLTAPTGDAVPVSLIIGGAASNTVTIAVQ